jgi:hypothetical protein
MTDGCCNMDCPLEQEPNDYLECCVKVHYFLLPKT